MWKASEVDMQKSEFAVVKIGSLAAVLALCAAACGGEGADAKPEGASSAKPSSSAAAKPGGAAKPATTAAAPDAAKPATGAAPAETAVTAPEQQSYSMDGIKTIPDNCSNAHVILANAPASVGADYPWVWSKQALLANQQFKAVSGAASAPGQVSFAAHQADASMAEAWVLLATCGDGSTCNRLASMYKAVVKSSNPTVFCGPVPANLGSPKKQVDLLAGGPEANLPQKGDTIGLCARIGACTVASKPDTKDDVGIQCQKAPTTFKTECASKYPCAEVMACLGK